MAFVENKNGITVKQLKEFVNNLPETNKYGEDYEIWISDSKTDLSNVAVKIISLNESDVLLVHN